MNTKIISYVLVNLFKILIFLFLFPLAFSLYYKEGARLYLSYLLPMFMLAILIFLFSKIDTNEDHSFFSKEGFVIVSLSWILMAFFGALPFFISSEIPSFTDSFFESVSGFTTTGASILSNVESLSKSMLFWRSFTHLIGGMGVLVLVLAIIPKGNNRSLHIMRAEVPGPTVGKLVAKMSYNSRILYIIYIAITLILILLLMFGGMSFYEACIHSFGTVGTGGFSSKNISVAYYNSSYIHYVLSFGMLACGLNFNLFYLLVLGNFKQVFKSEETKYYLSFVLISVILIALNIYKSYDSIFLLIRDVFFTVSSIITTTGYSTVDFDKWPLFSKTILLFLMFSGACAGSTAGGFKVSRTIIILKKIIMEFKKIGHPSKVIRLKLEGKSLDKDMLEGVSSYFMIYVSTFLILVLITSLETDTFLGAFSAVAATFNNIGPGFDMVGPTSNFGMFSNTIKYILSLGMLLGRLEIIPILILISPSIYRNID